MPLKDLEIRALKAQDRVYKRTDERGLYIEVHPSGSKLCAGPNTVISRVPRLQAAEDYWTPKRIAAAQPFDMIADDIDVEADTELDRTLETFLRGPKAQERSERSKGVGEVA